MPGLARRPHYLKIREGAFVELNLVETNYNGGLDGVLGLSESEPSNPTDVIGAGFESALRNGAVPIRLVYKAASGKNQTAKTVCSPEKADTVFRDAVGKTYAGRPIVEVRFPRRRCYTW